MPADDAPRTSPKAAPADHDHGYKLLFAHAEMVRDLLVGFVDEPWVNELQFDTLQRASASDVSHGWRSCGLGTVAEVPEEVRDNAPSSSWDAWPQASRAVAPVHQILPARPRSQQARVPGTVIKCLGPIRQPPPA